VVAEDVTKLAAALVLLVGASGCAGARTSVVADDARYPISLSRAVRDADGSLVESGRIVNVRTLQIESTAWGVLYSAVRLTPRTDISNAVNERVSAWGGDALVNVQISSAHCATDWFAVFTMLPFWPGCTNVVVKGDIVKVLPNNTREARR
jgi:hypothetical protein